MNRHLQTTAVAIAILAFVAIVYWPLASAGFVWVDKTLFHNAAWLRYGDGWKQLIFHDFYDWVNYFRPVVVALFVIEARVFDAAPGPMHLLSLVLHLANTLLVGAFATRLLANGTDKQKRILISIAMLVYGLHPALIEPVVWISCQAELLVTFFWLLGLLANLSIRQPALRALAVASCFFFAACSKESAVGFPLTLVLLDWIGLGSATSSDECASSRLRAMLRQQWPTYLAVLLAGIVYIVLRYWAMGFLTQGRAADPLLSLSRLQTACYVFLTYCRILVWPMVELGPLHIVDPRQFAVFSPRLLAIDVAALGIVSMGIYLAWKRTLLGSLVMAVTIALLPVLHIIPVDFDLSLYHERYAMTAAAMACALLPSLMVGANFPYARPKVLALAASAFAAIWLVVGTAEIRITVPLWSDDAKLWIWELTQHPDLIQAQNYLLETYVERDDREHAHEIADLMLKAKLNCSDCMLNIAALAVNEGDVPRLQAALELASPSIGAAAPQRLQRAFITATGQLHELQGDVRAAVLAYQHAIRMDPLDPQARMDLALLLARQGKTKDAKNVMDVALSLFTPDQRAHRQEEFEEVLNASLATPAQ